MSYITCTYTDTRTHTNARLSYAHAFTKSLDGRARVLPMMCSYFLPQYVMWSGLILLELKTQNVLRTSETYAKKASDFVSWLKTCIHTNPSQQLILWLLPLACFSTPSLWVFYACRFWQTCSRHPFRIDTQASRYSLISVAIGGEWHFLCHAWWLCSVSVPLETTVGLVCLDDTYRFRCSERSSECLSNQIMSGLGLITRCQKPQGNVKLRHAHALGSLLLATLFEVSVVAIEGFLLVHLLACYTRTQDTNWVCEEV